MFITYCVCARTHLLNIQIMEKEKKTGGVHLVKEILVYCSDKKKMLCDVVFLLCCYESQLMLNLLTGMSIVFGFCLHKKFATTLIFNSM